MHCNTIIIIISIQLELGMNLVHDSSKSLVISSLIKWLMMFLSAQIDNSSDFLVVWKVRVRPLLYVVKITNSNH